MTNQMEALDRSLFVAAVNAAIRAPSMHNTQPWRFRVRDGALEQDPDGVPASVGGPSPEPYDLLAMRDFGGRVRAPGRDFETDPLIAVLGTAGDTVYDQILAGQALQRVLLTATEQHLAVSMLSQPIEVPAARERLRAGLRRSGTPQMVLRMDHGDRTRCEQRGQGVPLGLPTAVLQPGVPIVRCGQVHVDDAVGVAQARVAEVAATFSIGALPGSTSPCRVAMPCRRAVARSCSSSNVPRPRPCAASSTKTAKSAGSRSASRS